MAADLGGGFYSRLHPAYQPFPEAASQSSGSGSSLSSSVQNVCSRGHSTSDTKLDQILGLLKSQQAEISSLKTDVNCGVILCTIRFLKNAVHCHYRWQKLRTDRLSRRRDDMKGHVLVPKDLSVSVAVSFLPSV